MKNFQQDSNEAWRQDNPPPDLNARRRRETKGGLGIISTSLFSLAFLLIITLQMSLSSGQVSFSSVSYFIDPGMTTVGTKTIITATVRLPSGSVYNNGDVLRITLPTDTTGAWDTSTTPVCFCTTSGVTIPSCSVTTQVATINLATTRSVQQIVFTISFMKNPNSASNIVGVSTALLSGSVTRATSTSTSITGFTPDKLTSASIVSQSSIIAQSGVTLRISFTPKNTLRAMDKGKIQVQFPEWNTGVPYISGNPVCSPVSSQMSSMMSCTFSQNILYVSNPVSSDQTGTLLTFQVTNFRNPYNAKTRTGFTIITTDEKYGFIDTSNGIASPPSLTVTGFAQFSLVTVDRTSGADTIVGADSSLDFLVRVGLPMDAGCRLKITFPSDMPLVSNKLTYVQAAGFGSSAFPSYTTSGNTVTIAGCPNTVDASTSYSFTLADVQNKGYIQETTSFTVQMYAFDGNGEYPIAQMSNGLTIPEYQFTSGEIQSLAIAAVTTKEIQKQTTYKVTILPSNSMSTTSKITVSFPTTITLEQGSCTISSPTGGMSTSVQSCSVSGQTLSIVNPFGSSGSYTASSTPLSFIFSTAPKNVAGTNPLSSKDAGTFTVATYRMIGTGAYVQDSGSFEDLFTPDPSTLIASVKSTSSLVAYYQPTTYTLEIIPLKIIPQNGVISIEFPPEVTLTGSLACRITKGSQTVSLGAIATISTSNPYKIQISDGFSTQSYTTTNTPFQIACDGFRNPRTTQVTSTFKIYTFDALGYGLEQGITGITTQMTQTPSMTLFQVKLSNLQNGFINPYTITFTSPVPLNSNDKIQFKFPPEVTLPSTLSCQAFGLLTSAICSKIGTDGTIQAQMTFSGGQVTEGSQVIFQVMNVRNPHDTRLTSPFSNIQIFDSSATPMLLTSLTSSGPTAQTTDFADVSTKTLIQSKLGISDPAEYTIKYTSINNIPSGGGFKIKYPTTVYPAASITKCQVVTPTATYTMTTCTIDNGNQFISISGGITAQIDAGTVIQVIVGIINNPNTQPNPGSFQLFSYVDSSFIFKIDQITSGLIPQFECNYPCKTCNLPNSKTECLSCQTTVAPEKYLSNKQCLTVCPDGTFADSNFICQPCDPRCKTCTSLTVCKSCKSDSEFPYLENDWCYESCSGTLCPINFVCQSCNAPKFLSVVGVPTPSQVNLVSNMQFTLALDKSVFANGDTLSFVIPQPGSFIPQTVTSVVVSCSSMTAGIQILSCSVFASQVMVKLQVSATNIGTATIQIGNFNNPSSTKDIQGLQAFLIDSIGNAKAVKQDGYITGITPARMQIASLTPSSNVIGASSLTLTVSFVIVSPFKTGYEIQMLVPAWNPNLSAINPPHMINSLNPICAGITNVNAAPTCSYDKTTRVLRVTNVASAQLASGSTMTFTVDNFLNPYNGQVKTGFQVSVIETSSLSYVDQTGALFVQATEFATLQNLKLIRSSGSNVVNEPSSLSVAFQLNLPIDANCVFRVVFPSDMPATITITQASGTNILSNVNKLELVDLPNNQINVKGCTSYIEPSLANIQSTLTFGDVTNKGWKADSGQFALELWAIEQGFYYKIARGTSSDLILKESELVTGSILNLAIAPVDTFLTSQDTRYKLTFQPEHAIQPNNIIKIKFPTDDNGITLLDPLVSTGSGVCRLSSPLGGVVSSAPCSVDLSTNTLSITNITGTTSYPKGGSPLSFIFSSMGTNPTKACPPGNFEVSTYKIINGDPKLYLIDYKQFMASDPTLTSFTPQASTLIASISKYDNPIASQMTSYTFQFNSQKVIPKASTVQFTFPTTVSFTQSNVNCRAVIGGQTIPGSTTVNLASSPIKFTISSFFSSSSYQGSNGPILITCDNILNPRNKLNSGNFKIDIQDLNGCAIESTDIANNALSVGMDEVPSFFLIAASSSVPRNGANAVIAITVNPSMKMIDGDIFYITFPSQIQLPSASALSCTAEGLVKSLQCSLINGMPNRLKAKITFTSGSNAANTQFTIKVNNVKNAPSTAPSSVFTDIKATDSADNDIMIFLGVGPTITNPQPASATGQLVQGSTDTGVQTDYTITYITENAMADSSSFMIDYPDIISVPNTISCDVTYGTSSSKLSASMTCLVNQAARTIKITSANSNNIIKAMPAGAQISIKLNPITNPVTQINPQSLRVTSYTDNSQTFTYDQVPNGLTPQYKCDLPCATCQSNNKKACLSCYTNLPSIKEKKLNGTTCLSQCPDGFYDDGTLVCKKCPAECLTCTGPKNCTRCDVSANSLFKNFFQGWCYSSCPDTFYSDSSFYCVKCDSNCKTCSNSATNCITCEQNSNFPLLSRSQCVSRCDNGFTSVNFQCTPCKAPCGTCVTTVDTCQSCTTGFLLGTKCLSQCPSGFTSDSKKCIGCDPRCEKCSPSEATRCLQCQSPLVLLNNTCISKCPDGYKSDSQGIVCQQVVFVDTGKGPNNGGNNNGNGNGGIGGNNYISADELYVNENNKTFTYFTTQIAQTVLGGVGVGSYFRDRTSSPWHTNIIGLWAPIETASFGGQLYLSYDQLAKTKMINITQLNGNGTSTNQTSNTTLNSTKITNTTLASGTKKRELLDMTKALTQITAGIVPLVFYGTAFALAVNIICNFLFALSFVVIMKQDEGYQEFVQEHKCHPYSMMLIGALFSFKMHKFFYTRFMGSYRIPFRNPQRIRSFFNVLTTLNIVFSLFPVILIDVYGLSKYKWGNQFYIMLIETLIYSLSMLVMHVIELRQPKEDDDEHMNMYRGLDDMSDKIDEEVRKRLAQALEDYAKRLKAERDGDKNLRRTKSMCDIGDREREEDDRRVNTDPLDKKKKKMYEDRMNPYHQVLDHDYPDNCYAEVGRNLKSPEFPVGKIQQTGQKVLSADEYDRDFDSRMRMMNMANMRNDQRLYGTTQGEDETPGNYKKRKNMRGRKGKYYSQVDDEDQTFLEQERRLVGGKGGDDFDDDDEERRLDMIEEESQHSTQRKLGDDDTKLLNKSNNKKLGNAKDGKTGDAKAGDKSSKATPKGSNLTSPRDQKQLEEKILKEQTSPQGASGKLKTLADGSKAIPEAAEEHEDEQVQKGAKKGGAKAPRGAGNGPDTSKGGASASKQSPRTSKNEPLRQSKPVVNIVKEETRDMDEDDILDDKEVVMNQRVKGQGATRNIPDEKQIPENGSFSKLKSEDMRKEIDKMSKKLEEDQIIKENEKESSDPNASLSAIESELGQPDSDSDEDKRLLNMIDPEKRKFNVNDILGDFDRDERGHPLILQDKKGELIDKGGHRVNEKGYLVDSKTGDILEKEKGRKIFSADQLDDRGELPPPFNLERYNFNGHDVRGYFDRDGNGNEILKGLKKDKQGFLIDKLGRRVNQHGYLVDMYGNLTDKRLRTKLHKHIMEQNNGEIPQLFTYKGKKFDLLDVMGNFDKDRKGNIIIRKDAKGKMVDKKGRPVNAKGYLIDVDGNVINTEGKVMFENFTLTKDGEIPKLFPFLKFNIDEVKGDYEMDPLGNPMLQKTRDGYLVDSKGRKVNSKGYLIDDFGNIVNKRKGKVFDKRLLEDDGEIPKVFRAGLLRKDTYDSFSQLMSEIEDLERLQEMEEVNQNDPRIQKMKKRMEKENQRMQQKIDKIVDDGHDEDEGMLMKELEELANGNNQGRKGGNRQQQNQEDGGHMSDGGNTSVDSMMEDTPSNYNALNQRFMEVENVKRKARQNMRAQQQVQENEEEDEEVSEYSYMPDRKMRKKKKKKKKKKVNDGTIDERELKMARAYGGLSQNQYDKLVALRKLQASQLPGTARVDTAGIPRTPSNMQSALQGNRFSRAGNNIGETLNRFNEDQRSDWGESQGPEGGRVIQMNNARKTPGGAGQSMSRQKMQGNSTSRIVIANKPPLRSNNLMAGSTNRSHIDGSEENVDHQMTGHGPQFSKQVRSKAQFEREQHLANVANSVSGFYKDNGAASDHQSQMSRTQDHFASNMGNPRRSSGMASGQTNNVGGGQGSPRGENAEYQRIYGTGNRQREHYGPGGEGGQLGDDMSDWERQSHRSGRSQMSQFSQVNQMKVKGLETIYLQRLEPATKGKKKTKPGADKARFRVMHHKYHDEPEWHVDDRDELDSIISGNYKEMQKKFEEEFQGSSHGTRSKKRRSQAKEGQQLFTGNLKQYKGK